MTTTLWESTLFGGWAIMRTPTPIASGALRPLAIASVSNCQLKVAVSCWLSDTFEESMREHKAAAFTLQGEHLLDAWRHAFSYRFGYDQSTISVNRGDMSICTITAVRGYTDWAASNSTYWTTAWKVTWDIAWHHLVMQALQRFPSEDIPLLSEVDPWLSPLQNFAFRVRIRAVTWNPPIIIPAIGQMDPYFAVWFMLRRRLIAAHQQPGKLLHSFSHEEQKFLYLLGLEKLSLTVQSSPAVQSPLKGQTTHRARESKSGKNKDSSKIVQQNFLWEEKG